MPKWTQEQKAAARIKYAEKMEKASIDRNPDNFITKVEDYNGEKVPVVEEKEGSLGFRMTFEEKVYSMINTAKVLPPNLIKNGRHLKENIQALNCFIVTDEMMDELYKDFKHEPF